MIQYVTNSKEYIEACKLMNNFDYIYFVPEYELIKIHREVLK